MATPVASTAERDGASLRRHHCGRTISACGGDSADHAAVERRHHVRTAGHQRFRSSPAYSFSPLVGAAVLWLFDDEDMVRTSALTIALVELALAIFVLMRFVPGSAAMQFVRARAMDPGLGHQLPPGGGRHQRAVRWAHGLSDRLDRHLSWDTIRHQSQALHDGPAGAGNDDHGGLHLAST